MIRDKSQSYVLKPETKRNLLAVSFYSGLLVVSFYLLVRVVLYIFASFRFGGFFSFRALVHEYNFGSYP